MPVIFQSTQEGDLPWREGQAVDLYPVEYDGKPANIAIRQPINHDPLPHVDGHGRRYSAPFRDLDALCELCWTKYDPRPEFARPPVNRVLTVFREQLTDHVDCGGDAASLARDWMREPWADHEWEGWTSVEIDHARKVLTRLANLKEN